MEFVRSTPIDAPASMLYDWHAGKGAFERLSPPWEDVRLVVDAARFADGEEVTLSAPLLGPLRARWVARYRDVQPGRSFTDVQVSGPFSRWEHTHLVGSDGPTRSVLTDRIQYALPLATLTRPLLGRWTERRLDRLFAWRHAVTRRDLAVCIRSSGSAPMRCLVTGSSGLVGSSLVPFLRARGDTVLRAKRGLAGSDDEVAFDPERGLAPSEDSDGLDAVVHLAGAGIADRRWSRSRKREIRNSRVEGTAALVKSLLSLQHPPKIFLSASAIGFYGSHDDGPALDESAPRGQGFLPEVCEEWEAAARPLAERGVRVVHCRFGVILSPRGGALRRMLPPFRLGLGGPLGHGRQVMSWISIEDVLHGIAHLLGSDRAVGPYNFVAPEAVTNREFTRALGRTLGRPAFLPAPALALRIALGEMADPLLLEGARVAPVRLAEDGYAFVHPRLEPALRDLLGKTASSESAPVR